MTSGEVRLKSSPERGDAEAAEEQPAGSERDRGIALLDSMRGGGR